MEMQATHVPLVGIGIHAQRLPYAYNPYLAFDINNPGPFQMPVELAPPTLQQMLNVEPYADNIAWPVYLGQPDPLPEPEEIANMMYEEDDGDSTSCTSDVE